MILAQKLKLGNIIWRTEKYCFISLLFGSLDHGTHFEKPGLLGTDGVHLSEEGTASSVIGLPSW